MDMRAEQDQRPSREGEGQQVIYVVEDDPRLLEFTALALACGRWQIKAFAGPEPALESFSSDHPKPAVLVTDYSMPSMTGLELGAKCKGLHSGLKIILVSGTAETDILDYYECPVDGFMSKPFQPKALLQLVNSVLDQ
jgi:two-component system, NtrC family, C4-dicarboxylate transport response regulator DctD